MCFEYFNQGYISYRGYYYDQNLARNDDMNGLDRPILIRDWCLKNFLVHVAEYSEIFPKEIAYDSFILIPLDKICLIHCFIFVTSDHVIYK